MSTPGCISGTGATIHPRGLLLRLPPRLSTVPLLLPALALTCSAVLAGCWTTPALRSTPDTTTLGAAQSRFCASDNPCPGLTREKLQVCGECDPATRYFRRAICSLDEKVRKAVDSCAQVRAGVRISGQQLISSDVKACVKQRLVNEPQVLQTFTSVAQGHKVDAQEQQAWRTRCDALWQQHVNNREKHQEQRVARAAPFYKRWWFWTAVGAVAVGAGAAIVVTTMGSDEPALGQVPWSSFALGGRR